MSTGVIFILGKGVTPILAYGVKSTWPQGSSAPGFSTSVRSQWKSTVRDCAPNSASHPMWNGHHSFPTS